MEQKKNLPSEHLIKPLIKLIIAIQLQILRHILMQNLWHDMSEARFSKQKLKNNKEKVFYTIDEVMELLNISRRTLQTLRQEGKIKFVKAHNTVRFSKDDIECFKEARVKE